MVKILLIIPYMDVEQQVYRQLQEMSLKDIEIETIHIFGTDQSAIKQKEPDIIVARGMTCSALRSSFPNIHMVEISMTSFDILAAVAEAKHSYSPKRIALCVGRLGRHDADNFQIMGGFEVLTFDLANESDVDYAIQEGVAQGVEVFIGGLTLCQQCRARNIPCVHIKTSQMTLQSAIEEAVGTAVILNQERAKTVLFQSLLNNSPDGILSVDNTGRITALNSNAYTMRRISSSNLMAGKKIDSYWKGIEWMSTIQTGKHTETLLEAYGSLYYARCQPIVADSSTIGALIIIQTAKTIQKAESKIRKELSNRGLTARYSFDDIVGVSSIMKNSISTALKYAQVGANVMLMGETGTGKELFAHSIHMASNRNSEPFVAVNCAALPGHLLESELFGYVEGAFSGAVKGGKIGLFELAHKGTIFLDEIGEMPISLQAKLLRVLQEKEVRRIGDDRVHFVDVRIISSTNINIQQGIAAGQFRSDLYYRLNLLNLSLVPLRERSEDIPVMTDFFLQLFAQKYNKRKPVLTEAALAALESYLWPGNSREMKNLCERIMVLNDANNVDVELLKQMGLSVGNSARTPLDDLPKPSKEDVLLMMKERKRTTEELARTLGISRTTLWRWSKELDQ